MSGNRPLGSQGGPRGSLDADRQPCLPGPFAAALAAGLLALTSIQPAFALDPARSFDQLHHTHWSLREGVPASLNALAQTPDGFLWLGAGSGLYRFDGMRAERFGVGRLPSLGVSSLAVGAGGDLWVGMGSATLARVGRGGVEVFKVPGRGSQGPVYYLAPAEDGSVWVGLRDRVLKFDGRWQAVQGAWPPATTYSEPGGVYGLALGRDGTLWAKNLLALYYLPRGGTAFRQAAAYGGGQMDFARDPGGRLWTADFLTRRFYALPELRPAQPLPPPAFGAPAPPSVLGSVWFDRDGALWNANRVTGGLHRLASVTRPAFVERFAPVGRTLDLPIAVLEDHEGAVWVGSGYGLERFRHANIVAEPALPVRAQAAGIVASNEAVYAYSGMGSRVPGSSDVGRRLYRIRPGQPPETVDADIGQLQAISASPDGELVIAREGELLRWRDGMTKRIAVPAEIMGGHVVNLVAEPRGGLLVSVYGRGVWRLAAGRWTPLSPPSAPPGDAASVAIDAAGAAWLFYSNGFMARVDGGRVTEFPEVGARLGRARTVLADPDGLIIAADFGLARFDGRSLQVLPAARTPGLVLPAGIARTAGDEIWILFQGGVARIPRAELLAAFARPARPLRYEVLDAGDGFKGGPPGDLFNASMVAGPDGRVWMLMFDQLAWIDPKLQYRNARPPPVVIRSVASGGRTYDAATRLVLPPGSSRLQVDYTALSPAAPEGVRFRYRLDGVDDDWIEAGGRRQAFYTNLRPGSYRFRVIAANRDGVWNTTGAVLPLTLKPAFWQTWIFKGLLVLAGLAALWGLYRLRLRQVSERIRARLSERMDERERIARELHDTLLQAFQGLTLRLQAYAEQMPAGQPARKLMEEALDRADEVLVEGRDRVRNLRSSQVSGDLPEALAATVGRLRFDPAVEVHVDVQGEPRPVHPIVSDEVVAIAGEALFNAFTHAQAANVWLTLRYEARQLAVNVRDDGGGIPAGILERGREGHFGLAGMRERARKIRGELTIRSRAGEGVDVGLTLPAGHAYVRPARRWLPFRSPQLEPEA